MPKIYITEDDWRVWDFGAVPVGTKAEVSQETLDRWREAYQNFDKVTLEISKLMEKLNENRGKKPAKTTAARS